MIDWLIDWLTDWSKTHNGEDAQNTNKNICSSSASAAALIYPAVSVDINVTVEVHHLVLLYWVGMKPIIRLLSILHMPSCLCWLYTRISQEQQLKSCSLKRVKTFYLVVTRKSWLIISLTEEALGLLTAFLLCFHKQAFESMKNNKRSIRK